MISKKNLIAKKKLISDELLNLATSGEDVESYVSKALETLSRMDDLEERFGFVLAALEHQLAFSSFKASTVERIQLETNKTLEEYAGSSQSIKEFVIFESSLCLMKYYLRVGQPESAMIVLSRVMSQDGLKINAERLRLLLSETIFVFIELGMYDVAKSFLLYLNSHAFRESNLAFVLLIEAKLYFSAGEVGRVLETLDRISKDARSSETLIAEFEWLEKCALASNGRDLTQLSEVYFSRSKDTAKLDYLLKAVLACRASADRKISRKVLKLDTIRRKFNDYDIRKKQHLYKSINQIEKLYHPKISEDDKMSILAEFFRVQYKMLTREEGYLALIAILRWSNSQRFSFIQNMVLGKLQTLDPKSSSPFSFVVSDLLSDMVPVVEQGLKNTYIDKVEYKLSKRTYVLAKTGLKTILNRVSKSLGKITVHSDSQDTFSKLADIKIHQLILSESRKLKGPILKFAQLFSAVEPEGIEVFKQENNQAPQGETFLNPAVIEESIKSELGVKSSDLLNEWVPEPIASASIGQVHRTYIDGLGDLAVKVQYPNIDRVIETDQKIINAFRPLFERIFPQVDVSAHLEMGLMNFKRECDYIHEAAMQEKYRTLVEKKFANDITIPKVHKGYSTSKVITTSFVHGLSMEQFISKSDSQQKIRASKAIFVFFWYSFFKDGLLMGDTHLENLLITSDQKVAVLDFGLAEQMPLERVELWRKFFRALIDSDSKSLKEVAIALEIFKEDDIGSVDFSAFVGNIRRAYQLDRVGTKYSLSTSQIKKHNADVTTQAPNRKYINLSKYDGMFVRFYIVQNMLLAKIGAEVDLGALFIEVLERVEKECAVDSSRHTSSSGF